MQRADWGLAPVGICTEYSEIHSDRNDRVSLHCILEMQSQKQSPTCCLLNQKQSATSNKISNWAVIEQERKVKYSRFQHWRWENDRHKIFQYNNYAKMMYFNLCYELKLLILIVIFYPELCLYVKLQRQEHWPKSRQLCQPFIHFLFIFAIVTRDSR